MKILVCNLNNKTTTTHLFDLFVKFGLIQSIELFRDSISGPSAGSGLIKMDKLSGAIAIQQLNNMKFMNYYIDVFEVSV